MGRLILTAYGIQTMRGFYLIKNSLYEEQLESKNILLVSLPEDEIEKEIEDSFIELGFHRENVVTFYENHKEQLLNKKYDMIYISEPGHFEMMDLLYRSGLYSFITECIEQGADCIVYSLKKY